MAEKAKESIILKEPLPVIEVPQKKIIRVDEKSQKSSSEIDTKDEEEMDISMESGDVISPDNKT